MTTNPLHAGLEGGDLARAQASDANLAAIIAGRRRAALALVPAVDNTVKLTGRWAPITRRPELAVPPSQHGPVPEDWNLFRGTGAPTTVPGARRGDYYVDTTTDDLYRLETP